MYMKNSYARGLISKIVLFCFLVSIFNFNYSNYSSMSKNQQKNNTIMLSSHLLEDYNEVIDNKFLQQVVFNIISSYVKSGKIDELQKYLNKNKIANYYSQEKGLLVVNIKGKKFVCKINNDKLNMEEVSGSLHDYFNLKFWYSAYKGDLKTIKKLVEGGIVYKNINIDGHIPLHTAVYRGHLRIVEYLIEKVKPDLSQKGLYEEIALYKTKDEKIMRYIIKHTPEKDIKQLLLDVCRDGRLDILKILLEEKKVDINEEYNNETPLGVAVRNQRVEVVEFLLAKKANPNIEDGNIPKKSLLWGALYSKNIKIIELLIKAGVKINRYFFCMIFFNPDYENILKYLIENKLIDLNTGFDWIKGDDVLLLVYNLILDKQRREKIIEFLIVNGIKDSGKFFAKLLMDNENEDLKKYVLNMIKIIVNIYCSKNKESIITKIKDPFHITNDEYQYLIQYLKHVDPNVKDKENIQLKEMCIAIALMFAKKFNYTEDQIYLLLGKIIINAEYDVLLGKSDNTLAHSGLKFKQELIEDKDLLINTIAHELMHNIIHMILLNKKLEIIEQEDDLDNGGRILDETLAILASFVMMELLFIDKKEKSYAYNHNIFIEADTHELCYEVDVYNAYRFLKAEDLIYGKNRIYRIGVTSVLLFKNFLNGWLFLDDIDEFFIKKLKREKILKGSKSCVKRKRFYKLINRKKLLEMKGLNNYEETVRKHILYYDELRTNITGGKKIGFSNLFAQTLNVLNQVGPKDDYKKILYKIFALGKIEDDIKYKQDTVLVPSFIEFCKNVFPEFKYTRLDKIRNAYTNVFLHHQGLKSINSLEDSGKNIFIKLILDTIKKGLFQESLTEDTINIIGQMCCVCMSCSFFTPLHTAIYSDSKELVDFLIGKKYIDINKKNSLGETPLYAASKNKITNHYIEKLLANGADPRIMANDNTSTITLVKKFEKPGDMLNQLKTAVFKLIKPNKLNQFLVDILFGDYDKSVLVLANKILDLINYTNAPYEKYSKFLQPMLNMLANVTKGKSDIIKIELYTKMVDCA
jgi:ankyrin repeat protein